MKKWMLVLTACFLVLAFSAPDFAEAAKPKGGYKSGTKTYSPTDTKQDPAKTDSGKTTTNATNQTTTHPSTTASTATKPGGFFSGGLMKGLMIGGLAGLLFGSLFGGLGPLGDFLGLLINVLALVMLFALVRKVVMYFVEKRKLKKRFQE